MEVREFYGVEGFIGFAFCDELVNEVVQYFVKLNNEREYLRCR